MALETESPKPKRSRRFSQIEREPAAKGFAPSMPTCGNDLIGLWDLPHEAVTQARLKIGRNIPMSQQLELVRDCTVQDYSLESVAHTFGPGEYQLVLNPGPGKAWPGKSARIIVSKDFARECGFSPYAEPAAAPAPPRFSELRSIQESTRAMNEGGAFTPQVMAQLLETVADRVAERLRPSSPAADPLAGMASMVQMMTFMQGIQKSAMDQALLMAGMRNPVTPEPEEEDSWPSVLREAIPVLGQIGQGLLSRAAPAPAPAPTPQETPQPEENKIMVPMNSDEIKQFSSVVGMLKPYSALILTILSKVRTGGEASADLASFVPDRMRGTMIDFADLAETRGAEVLALLDPALATEKGLDCVVGIGRILREV